MSHQASYESERLYFRKLTEQDVTEDYIQWFKNGIVTRYLGARDLTKQDVVDYIAQGEETGEYYMYGIFFKETSEHIGNVKVGPIDRQNNISDLVTVIGNTNYWGKGLATEAIRLGSEMAFKEYNIRKLAGSIIENNQGSVKAYTRAGWVIECQRKEQYLVDGELQGEIFVACYNPNI